MTPTARLALVLGTALLSLTACQSSEKAATTVESAAQAQMTPTLSTTDATFINLAGTAGIEEVTFGQLAEKKGATAAVRRFAARMVKDHTQVNQQLTELAQAKQMTPPTSMDTEHDQMLQQLQGMHGRAFDRAYINGQVQDHMTVIQAFQNEAQNGTDPDVRSFAEKNLPTLQEHLKMAEKLAPRH